MHSNSLYPIRLNPDNNLNIKTDGSVAILMRTKNRPVLLARALESVILQQYSNWHLYLINDGGTPDEVNDLIELNHAYLQNKVTVIHNPHSLGMEAASNCGFNQANEEFVVVHDDDDSWHPMFLNETVNFLKVNKDAVAVITNCLVINEEIQGDTVKRLKTSEWGYWQDNIDITCLIKNNISPPISLLIRMSIAKSIGGFNEQLPVLGDWDYNLRLFRVGEIKTLNKKLAYYHHRPNINNNYGNSVIAGVDKHHKYQIEYRNSLVRQSLLENQGNYGILHVLLLESERTNNELIQRLNGIEASIWYLRSKSFPIKRFIHFLRDKIRKIKGK